jgi:ATP-dependent DNA helicase DinG
MGDRTAGRAAGLLGQTGPFAARLGNYESRAGQMRVAHAVERALTDDGVLICEAGTGIGKTFGYLVPAVLSGRKVVISTATKTLQDQIAERDLPLVQEVLGTDVPSVVMKGLSNYLCRRRYREFLLSVEGARPSSQEDLQRIAYFLKATETGDLAELATVSEKSKVRLEVSSSSETRLGPRCPDFEPCFVTQMRREAERAQIVIVNHHLFFADLALRGPHPGRVLPEYDAVIFDEAHQMEDIAAQFFGVRLTEAQILRLLGEIRRLLGRLTPFSGPLDKTAGLSIVERAAHAALEFFSGLSHDLDGSEPPRRTKTDVHGLVLSRSPELESALRDVEVSLEGRVVREADGLIRDEIEQAERRLEAVRASLESLRNPGSNSVVWFDAPGKALCLTPVDLGSVLSSRLFDSVPSVSLLSATLSTERKKPNDQKSPFGFMKARLGVGLGRSSSKVTELCEPSPFDYQSHCLFYVPRDLPDANSSGFLEGATERAIKLIQGSEGGAFLLTTSLASVAYFATRLKKVRLPWPILVQGERPKEALLATFRSLGNAVLVATSSFWEGVDVPGPALRLLILEKLPFPVPTDPVYEARARAIEERGGSSFAELALPAAAIALKQGFGRLIRSGTDRGVVALLDRRLVERPYGKRLLGVLPEAQLTSDIERALDFFAELRKQGTPPRSTPNRLGSHAHSLDEDFGGAGLE